MHSSLINTVSRLKSSPVTVSGVAMGLSLQCEENQIGGMLSMKYENKEITFNVNNYLAEKIRIKKKAGAIAIAITGAKTNEDDFLDEVNRKSIAETERSIDSFIKYAKETNEDYITFNKINGMLDDLGSNLRLTQYIYITKDLSVSSRVWLCGNGYFRKVFQLSDIQIPCRNYYGYEHEEEWKKEYENEYIYITEDTENTKVSLSENFDDGIDYTKSYMDVISQVLAKNKVIARHDMVGWVDVRSKDGKIDAELSQIEVCDIFLMQHVQEKIDRYDSRYEIDIAELNKIVEQLES